MDSRLIFLPHVRMRREDGRHDVGHLIGLVLLAVGQGDGKSTSIRPKQTKPPQGGIRQKSFPRKVPKHNAYVHVPKTDTGGLV